MDTNYVIQLFADFISRSDPNILKYLINYNIDLHEAYPDSFPKPHVVNFFINLLGLDRKTIDELLTTDNLLSIIKDSNVEIYNLLKEENGLKWLNRQVSVIKNYYLDKQKI